jgi:hypothetical protein
MPRAPAARSCRTNMPSGPKIPAVAENHPNAYQPFAFV